MILWKWQIEVTKINRKRQVILVPTGRKTILLGIACGYIFFAKWNILQFKSGLDSLATIF